MKKIERPNKEGKWKKWSTMKRREEIESEADRAAAIMRMRSAKRKRGRGWRTEQEEEDGERKRERKAVTFHLWLTVSIWLHLCLLVCIKKPKDISLNIWDFVPVWTHVYVLFICPFVYPFVSCLNICNICDSNCVRVCVCGWTSVTRTLIHHIKEHEWGMGLKLDGKSYYAKAWL